MAATVQNTNYAFDITSNVNGFQVRGQDVVVDDDDDDDDKWEDNSLNLTFHGKLKTAEIVKEFAEAYEDSL
jgi:hypothetical protein